MRKRANKMVMYSYIIVAVMVLSMLLSFRKVADFVGGTFNIASEKVRNTARTVLGVSVGVYLISSGVAALSVPIIGLALIVIGIIVAVYFLWPYLKKGE